MAYYKRVDNRNTTVRQRPSRRCRAVFRAPKPIDTSQQSFFEFMPDEELEQAKIYFYDHPEELPYRLSGAHQKANLKPLPVMVEFDEKIFERKMQLRPIPDWELEEVDPFALLGPDSQEISATQHQASSTTLWDESKKSVSSYYVRSTFTVQDVHHGPRDCGYVQMCGRADQCRP